jgi:hypothetical protein
MALKESYLVRDVVDISQYLIRLWQTIALQPYDTSEEQEKRHLYKTR